MNDAKLALEIVKRVYQNKTDLAGAPYISHLLRVEGRLWETNLGDEDVRTVALLHDIVEDGYMTIGAIHFIFGPEVGTAVGVLTRRANIGETYEDYIRRVKENPIAVKVKLVDLADNMDPERLALLTSDKRYKLETKYHAALEVLNQV